MEKTALETLVEDAPALETDCANTVAPAQESFEKEKDSDKDTDKWDKIDIGCEVMVGPGYPGRLLAFMAFENHVRYRCAWWDGPKRYVAWLDPCELDVKNDDDSLAFGFHCQQSKKENDEAQA